MTTSRRDPLGTEFDEEAYATDELTLIAPLRSPLASPPSASVSPRPAAGAPPSSSERLAPAADAPAPRSVEPTPARRSWSARTSVAANATAPSSAAATSAAPTPAAFAPPERRGAAAWLRAFRATSLARRVLVSLVPGVVVLIVVAARSGLSSGAPSAKPAGSTRTAVATAPRGPAPSAASSAAPRAPMPTSSESSPRRSTESTSELERRAIVAVKRGSFQEAATLYAQLAQQHPDSPLYRDAARLARRKAGGGR